MTYLAEMRAALVHAQLERAGPARTGRLRRHGWQLAAAMAGRLFRACSALRGWCADDRGGRIGFTAWAVRLRPARLVVPDRIRRPARTCRRLALHLAAAGAGGLADAAASGLADFVWRMRRIAAAVIRPFSFGLAVLRLCARKRVAAGIAAALTLAGLAWAAIPHARPAASAPPSFGTTWEQGWVVVERPLELFALPLPNGIASPRYVGERRVDGDARRDTLRVGSLAQAGPFIAVSVQRRVTGTPLDVAGAAARLAEASVAGTAMPRPMPSKFGAFAAVEVAAGGRACLAFSRQVPHLELVFDGLYCGSADVPVDRRMARCLVDRLALVAMGDARLRAFFAGAERRRDYCGAGDLRATGARRAWFDSGAVLPKLRSSFAAQ